MSVSENTEKEKTDEFIKSVLIPPIETLIEQGEEDQAAEFVSFLRAVCLHTLSRGRPEFWYHSENLKHAADFFFNEVIPFVTDLNWDCVETRRQALRQIADFLTDDLKKAQGNHSE